MNKLEKARAYEKEAIKEIPAEQRPVFHMTPAVGWTNDPNGFSYYKGEYHLFYQYNPYDVHWGPMHWGHCTSKDLICWEWLPAVMAPDEDYESGCYSGTAAVFQDGQQLLMYTAHYAEEQQDGKILQRETQCIAYGDGRNYQKYEQNPVITTDMIPEGINVEEFRDPKIWKDEDGWNVIASGMNQEKNGEILYYHSEDSIHWKFVNSIAKSSKALGGMWECPDIFSLNGKDILVVSPMEMMATRDLEFHNGHETIYLLGQFDKAEAQFKTEIVKTLDYGLDFYAPQSIEAEDGRRILVGWMQAWENYMTPSDFKWSGMMSVPREVILKDGVLCQQPIREIEQYHRNGRNYKDCIVSSQEKVELYEISGRTVDLKVTVKGNDYERICINVAENETYVTSIWYDKKEGLLTFDRKYSGLKEDIIDTRSIKVDRRNEELTLRILLDRYSVEVFVNDGQQVMTSLIYTPQEATGISFACKGSVCIDVEKYDIVAD